MSLIINHNISAMNTQRNLEGSSRMLSKSLQRLSSGYKINVASDDPSGLIISEQLRSQTNSIERAVRNSQEASNVIGIAEGALIEINEMLRSLRALALHAANNGVTAPDQIRADQSEVDSAISTIDRIANTTKYSDQFLLNGSKGLIYDATVVTGNSIIDTGKTRLDQVFKRTGLILGINYTGATATNGIALMTKQAQRAMYEADGGGANDQISNTTNQLTAEQKFIVTGNRGSMQFGFSQGTDVAQVVSSIENVSDSTGVHASLTLASNSTAVVETMANLGTFDIYGAQTGVNTDAQGQLYFEVVAATNTVNVYSDAGGANLVATGTYAAAGSTVTLQQQNDSGIWGTVVAVVDGNEGPSAVSPRALTDAVVNEANDGGNVMGTWILNGIDVGNNTDSEGRIYVDFAGGVPAAGDATVTLYKDANLTQVIATGTRTGVGAITLVEQNNSGLAGTVTIASVAAGDSTSSVTLRPRLGARLYSDEYGSNQFLRMQVTQGKMWEYYNSASAAYVRVDSTAGVVTSQVNGQDATVAVNGTDVLVSGLEAEVATPVFSGLLAFNEGSLFNTTMAQAGYDRGTGSSAIGSMFVNTNLAVNAGENSAQNLENIQNGMQFQLGETDGDQSRTVYGIPSMNVPNLGQVEIDGTTYTLQDVLGGGVASLMKDPVIAMRVISQAIDDVSSLRARLGAFQKNMLQTNINSLNVAVENVTLTESAIRDANMAAESSEFTKNQILMQAGTAMLAQANVVSQNVLQLLG